MKKISQIILTLLLWHLMPVSLLAGGADDFAGGDGSAAHPYLISTPAQLDSVRKYMGPANAHLHFALTNDIDLAEVSNWRPLGLLGANYNDDELVFFGHFDGCGHVVRNMKIKSIPSDSLILRKNLGLFGYAKAGSSIRNLGVVDGTIEFNSTSAGLLCGAGGPVIENCYTTGKIKGGTQMGGIVGYYLTLDKIAPAVMRNCYSIVTIECRNASNSNGFCGGIAGNATLVTFNHCFSLCNISGDRAYEVGGIVGMAARSKVEYCYSFGRLKGLARVGGINGYQLETTYVNGCFSSAQVLTSPYTKDLLDDYVRNSFGGVIGAMYSTLEVIKECYYNKDIYAGDGVGVDASGLYKDGAASLTTAGMKKEESWEGSGWKFGPRWSIWEDRSFPYWAEQGSPVEITIATPTYIEGNFNVEDMPDKVVLYNSALQAIGELSVNISGQSWRLDLEEPLTVNDLVYAIAYIDGYPSVPAQARVANTYFAGGDGSTANPFRIQTIEQLRNLSYYMGPAFAGLYFALDNDLDLVAEMAWKPLRGADSDAFFGHLDGLGYKIKNMNMVDPLSDSLALFRVLGSGAELKNLQLLGVNVAGRNVVGTLCAVNNGTISHCFVMGRVQGADRVGGLCAINNKTIDNTSVMLTLEASGSVAGGLCGYNTATGLIQKSYATGDVSAQADAAGLCGSNAGVLTLAYASGKVTAPASKAGLCAINSGTLTLSYFDKEKAGTDQGVHTGDQTGVTALTTEGAKKKTSYRNWLFSSAAADWAIWEGHSTPYFARQAAPPVITSVTPTKLTGISQAAPAPDSIIVYKNYERIATCIPGTTSWEISLSGLSLQVTDVLYAVASMKGKALSSPALVQNMPNDVRLKELSVTAGALIPAFTPDVLEYRVMPVGQTVGQTIITAAAFNAGASIKGAGNRVLYVGNNRLSVEVTAEDGVSVQTYVINVLRKDNNYVPGTDAGLLQLNVTAANGGSLIPGFTPATTAYAAEVPAYVDRVTVTAVTSHPYAAVSGTGVFTLNPGANTFTVTCVAENGTTQQEYVISITRKEVSMTLSDNADLTALALDQAVLSPVFNKNNDQYTARVAASVASLRIMAAAEFKGALVKGAGLQTLAVGRNIFVIEVIAEDARTKKYYTITVDRAVPADAELQHISVGARVFSVNEGPDFVYVAECGVTAVNVTVEANDGTTIYINGKPQPYTSVLLPESGIATLDVKLVSADQLTSRQYTLRAMRSLPASAVKLRWNTILSLSNNPVENGGHQFVSYQWYRNGSPVTGETGPYLRKDGAASEYIVKAYTAEGYELHSCASVPAPAPAAMNITVYPNPAPAGGVAYMSLSGQEESRLTTVKLFTLQGQLEQQYSVYGSEYALTMPSHPGVYILQVLDGQQQLATFKVLVY